MRGLGVRTCVALLAVTTVVASSSAAVPPKLAARLERAARVLQELADVPEDGIPRDLLARAHAVAVFPDVVKGAFFFGGRLGDGDLEPSGPEIEVRPALEWVTSEAPRQTLSSEGWSQVRRGTPHSGDRNLR